MRQPKGFEKEEGKVCRLHKTLYGLKQAGMEWNKVLTQTLQKHGLYKSKFDESLFYLPDKDFILFVIVYVDDLLMASSSSAQIEKLKSFLCDHFEMKDIKITNQFLGINFKFINGSIFLSQEKKINTLLTKHRMDNCHPTKSPCSADMRDRLNDAKVDSTLTYPVREILGALNHLAITCRPDICYVVSVLSRFMDKQSEELWLALKRVLRYLKGTANYGIMLSVSQSPQLVFYSDADWAGDTSDRKSTTGCLALFGVSPIIWQSKKQSCVATSSTAAEYIALSETGKWIYWLRSLIEELNLNILDKFSSPSVLFTDSQSAFCQAIDPGVKSKARHIDVRYHYIKDLIESSVILLKRVATEDNLADIFTKPLGKVKFIELCHRINIVDMESSMSGSDANGASKPTSPRLAIDG